MPSFDLKSMALGAAAMRLAEPWMIKGIVFILPKAVTWLLTSAERNPEVRHALAVHKDEFKAAFDAMDAAAKKVIDEAEAEDKSSSANEKKDS